MQQYVIYTRVSTIEQGKSGLGLDAQDKDIDIFLSSYSAAPYEIVGRFKDVLSGGQNDRPELAKALDMARKTGAELLVAKLDRLSRRVSFIAQLMDDPKVKLRVASMPHADKFQLHIYAALAEQERDFISKRTTAALRAAKAKGRKLGGIRPGTLARAAGAKARADEDAHRLVTFIGPLRNAGWTLTKIADALERDGRATPRGGKWTAMQVKRVLDRVEATAS